MVYSRLPLWYHLIGLPEILVQTLLFSALAALVARHPVGTIAALPPVARRAVRAVAVACFAFIGYAVVSVAFALAAGARIDASANFTLATQGVFLFPLLVNAIIVFAADGLPARLRLLAAVASYALGAVGIAVYQAVVFGSVGIAYATIAPIAPAVIVWLLIPRSEAADRERAPDASADRRR
ncbi:MAG: hypothetical protein EOO24_47125 [Comamonadaceae bacterium]|nr:MAG: hypothetical protein EOO24_47125 [Comamonadaceae bacterium]